MEAYGHTDLMSMATNGYVGWLGVFYTLPSYGIEKQLLPQNQDWVITLNKDEGR